MANSGLLTLSGHAELAAAILLVVEAILAQQLVAAVAEAALTPVLRPEHGAWHGGLGRMAGKGDLLQALPARRGQRGGEMNDAQLASLAGGGQQTHVEALLAAAATLRLMLQARHMAAPRLVVVVAVDPRQAQALGVALALLLADGVFLLGIDVGIEIVDGGADAIGQHPLNNGAAARGTAGVEQHLGAAPLGQQDGRLTMFHGFISEDDRCRRPAHEARSQGAGAWRRCRWER